MILFCIPLTVLCIVFHRVNSCPSNIAVGSKCYEVITDGQFTERFAGNHCFSRSEYTKLAEPLTSSDNEKIKQTLLQICDDEVCSYWFGLKLNTVTKQYQFEHDVTTYTDWYAGERYDGHCVAYVLINNYYRWKSKSCKRLAGVICEMRTCPDECIPLTTAVPATQPTSHLPSTSSTSGNVTSTHNVSTIAVEFTTQPTQTSTRSSGHTRHVWLPLSLISFMLTKTGYVLQ